MPRALILAPQRRSMVSSRPITIGGSGGAKPCTNTISGWRAATRDDHAARRRPGRAGEKMRVSHPIGRIGELNRGNIAPVRQIESIGSRDAMVKSEPVLAQIAARFARHDVEWNRGAYVIVDRRTALSIAL